MAKKSSTSGLYEVLCRCRESINRLGDYQLSEDYMRLKQTYVSMLHFLANGTDDPNALSIYHELLEEALTLANRAERMERLRMRKSDKYCLTVQQLASKGSFIQTLQDIALQNEQANRIEASTSLREEVRTYQLDKLLEAHEASAEQMFEQVWTSTLWNQSEAEAAWRLTEAEQVMERDKSLLVSAVTLSLQEMFDKKKVEYLLSACDYPSPTVRLRALVGVILTLWRWNDRVAACSQLAAHVSLLLAEPSTQKEMFRCMIQLQRSRLTAKLSKRISNDIIPDLLNSGFFKAARAGAKDVDEYLTRNGENSEWNRDNEKAQARMEEMAKMELEGGDIYMAAFSHTKGGDFFRQIGHWFLPFDMKSPLVAKFREVAGGKSGGVFHLLLNHMPSCDSDKYSFALMVAGIGANGRELMSAHLEKGIPEDFLNEASNTPSKAAALKPEALSRNYVYDLYRFYVLYPYHLQFRSPFADDARPFTPLTMSCMGPLLDNKEEVRGMADSYMRLGFYHEALSLFLALHPLEQEDDVEIWQRVAFCEEKLQKSAEAYTHYSLAYRLNPASDWTLRKTAAAAFGLRRYDEAYTLYSLLQVADEDDLNWLSLRIACKMNTGQYAHALPLLYKAAYLSPDSRFQRDLIVCLLCSGDTAKAREVADRLVKDATNLCDNLCYAGAVSVAEGHSSQACHEFMYAYQMSLTNEAFMKAFAEIRQRIAPLGADTAVLMDMIYDVILHAQSLQQD